MESGDWLPAAMAIGGYLIGSIPFGVVVSKCLGTVDPRTAGSHNIGFTNVLRVSGKKAGALTLAGDMGKGWLVGWTAQQMLDRELLILGVTLCAIIGHLFPIFLNFRGGKGVSTAIGAVGGVAPAIGSIMVIIWLATAGLWRYSSSAAVATFLSLPILSILVDKTALFVGFSAAVTGLIVVRHMDNMRRLWQGTEPKIGQVKS